MKVSVVITEMQIQTTVKYHPMTVRMAIIRKQEMTNAGMNVNKKEALCIVGGIVNWYNHYGKQYTVSSKKLKIEQPYDLAIPLLGIDPKGTTTLIQKDICILILALFRIVKMWEQP